MWIWYIVSIKIEFVSIEIIHHINLYYVWYWYFISYRLRPTLVVISIDTTYYTHPYNILYQRMIFWNISINSAFCIDWYCILYQWMILCIVTIEIARLINRCCISYNWYYISYRSICLLYQVILHITSMDYMMYHIDQYCTSYWSILCIIRFAIVYCIDWNCALYYKSMLCMVSIDFA